MDYAKRLIELCNEYAAARKSMRSEDPETYKKQGDMNSYFFFKKLPHKEVFVRGNWEEAHDYLKREVAAFVESNTYYLQQGRGETEQEFWGGAYMLFLSFLLELHDALETGVEFIRNSLTWKYGRCISEEVIPVLFYFGGDQLCDEYLEANLKNAHWNGQRRDRPESMTDAYCSYIKTVHWLLRGKFEYLREEVKILKSKLKKLGKTSFGLSGNGNTPFDEEKEHYTEYAEFASLLVSRPFSLSQAKNGVLRYLCTCCDTIGLEGTDILLWKCMDVMIDMLGGRGTGFEEYFPLAADYLRRLVLLHREWQANSTAR